MKALLEFELPEDEEELRICQQGPKWKSVVSNITSWVRNKRKHGELTVDELAVYDAVWEKIWETLNDEELTIW